MTTKPRIIVICGPTGIGKTATAIAAARACRGQIVGADSMQIYTGMDIGTAKPDAGERAAVVHHMIDIVPPDAPFDAWKYACMARGIITWLHRRNIPSIVAGGTGLYIKTLLHGLFEGVAIDPAIRTRLKQEVSENGPQAVYRRLQQSDPAAAARLHPNDTHRVIRALEVRESTGSSILRFQSAHGFSPSPFEVLKIGLDIERQSLYERINRRVDAMVAQGLLEEVRGLLDSGVDARLKSMQSIGYRHMIDYLAGRVDWNESLRVLKRDTRRYAKRQLTWFGKEPDIHWYRPDQISDIRRRVLAFLDGDSAYPHLKGGLHG